MFKNPIFLMEFLLFDGLFLGLAIWQFWTVRRSKIDEKPPEPKSPEGPGHPEG